MFCTRCGTQLDDKARFCSQCAHPTVNAVGTQPRRPLALDTRNKKIGGVCAGFARHLDVDVTLIRIFAIAATICTGGLFLFAYFGAWIMMSKDDTAAVDAPGYVRQNS